MKKMRRFAAIAAAAAMTACMAVPMMSMMSASAVATKNYVSFTGETVGTHTYTAYCVFTGTATKSAFDGTAELKDINWAMSETVPEGETQSNADKFLAALKSDATIGTKFATCKNAAEVAKVLAGFTPNSTEAKAFAKFVVAKKELLPPGTESSEKTINLTNDGYYVIEETAFSGDTENGASDGAKTLYLLGVYDADTGAEIVVKSSFPSVEKKIQENVKTGTWENDDLYGDRYNDTADFSIGDTVPFKLIGTLPSTLDTYDTYQYIFHDTLGQEFTLDTGEVTDTVFDADDVAVTIGGTPVTEGFTVEAKAGTKTVKNQSGENVEIPVTKITVKFTDIKSAIPTSVTVNADTKVVVTYNATLNENAVIGQPGQVNEVYLEYSNNPNNGGNGTSHTKVDKVIAFTYELDVTKIDGANKTLKLEGAKFVLSRVNGATTEYAMIDAKNRITGWVSGNFTFDATTGEVTGEAEEKPSVVTSGSDGTFKFIGLDDGTYSLTETLAPVGYNKLTTSIPVVISAETNNAQNDDSIDGTELSALTIKVNNGTAKAGTVADGKVAMDVENNSGSTLPSTGGIGTTLFYVIGGTMAAGAGVALIAKKRMKNEE